ncbi:MAG TPA: 1-deoxy-D-xylulose-5-phosphate synthase [Candidatus Moranbacteria bacterium]|jgi:1-deoxy-D-xylulose-5-phosphate synthase|nr:1-deoxy-D-xylulose-5-phosphate synthase [Candidatus Moranbacteria bacterium]HPX94463.1 1-deoxy-D-xylulose-5-phosphate synthase [Candidatus Moranbacteria bacterium]HQB59640.1 1-deoxy-D-xylulose-5-phosphate synthase [Candidatus Moranbacteria bacterium]
MKKEYKILDKINFPEDLKNVPDEDLPEFCGELRNFLIESVAQSGGHFGSNLGVVELTVALHYVFDAPKDILLWDVGHQAYPHKILTGRRDKIHTIRKRGGLAPFPKREESEYDAMSMGHSSTSVSAAIGMAVANKNKKNHKQVIAVIGDGALTGGMAFEALNHAGDIKADILVILNDNKMSISPNVGGMNNYLTRLISSPSYQSLHSKGREFLESLPSIQRFLRKAEKQAKGMIMPGTLFEELGFRYYGPVDGHDVKMLIEVLENLKKIRGPKFLHIITKKGKGYTPAENDEFSLHAVKPFDPCTGKKNGSTKNSKSYSDVFSDWVCDTAEKDYKLHAITPAMCEGTGLKRFSKEFPKRYHDVGIAEQHAITFAAGLSHEGKKPVVAIYSSFLQRSYDQLIHDIAIQNLNILLAIDRAGIVGPDGATHSGSFDLSFLRTIPKFVIMTPTGRNECYSMLKTGYDHKGPAAVRYPRANVKDEYSMTRNEAIEIGKADVVCKGKDIAILAFGPLVENCRKATDELGATLVNMRFVKPLDEELLKNLAKTHKYFVTVEDNAISGGAGSAVNEFFAREKIKVFIKGLGLPDKFLDHGTREEILIEAGLDEEGILKSIKSFIK